MIILYLLIKRFVVSITGRKKKDKAMQQAMMMAGMMAAAVMGPMAFKMLALIAGKALLLSKIALVLSGIIALKKLLQPQQGGHESESVSHHYGRSLQLEAHDVAYSAQKPHQSTLFVYESESIVNENCIHSSFAFVDDVSLLYIIMELKWDKKSPIRSLVNLLFVDIKTDITLDMGHDFRLGLSNRTKILSICIIFWCYTGFAWVEAHFFVKDHCVKNRVVDNEICYSKCLKYLLINYGPGLLCRKCGCLIALTALVINTHYLTIIHCKHRILDFILFFSKNGKKSRTKYLSLKI
ncbi:hypothetical protein AGLY_012456 [Aphis glycines]|uniref:Uncharacterized protein n=1 Tax=Aphis glycines TaxID=307491 RepID=A0A6G0TBG1_APHGL|nr:hypothetical protein AGLY_012456 [Aphis glycines]